jgi:hypothetical protein
VLGIERKEPTVFAVVLYGSRYPCPVIWDRQALPSIQREEIIRERKGSEP